MICHGMRNQSADRRACRDAVTVFDGHAVCHEATHREACEEHAVKIDGILFGERVEECHEEARVVGVAGHQSGVPHRAVAFVQRLRHHDGPMELVGHLLEMELVVQARDVVAQAMQEKQDGHSISVHRWRFDEILTLCALPFKSLNLGEQRSAKH